MNLVKDYNALYENAVKKIRSGEYQLDRFIDAPFDNRLGISLLIRPDNAVREKIHAFLDKLKISEPGQYYYSDSDIHITVLTLINAYNGFQLDQIKPADYIDIIGESLSGFKNFNIQLRGVTASPSCVMIQGFTGTALNAIRNRLRENFRDSGLEHSIDKRYRIKLAHATVVRLKTTLRDKDAFIKLLEKYDDFNFGSFNVDKIEFICHDWYLRNENSTPIYSFKLR